MDVVGASVAVSVVVHRCWHRGLRCWRRDLFMVVVIWLGRRRLRDPSISVGGRIRSRMFVVRVYILDGLDRIHRHNWGDWMRMACHVACILVSAWERVLVIKLSAVASEDGCAGWDHLGSESELLAIKNEGSLV